MIVEDRKYRQAYLRWQGYKDLILELREELESISAEREIEERFYRYLEFGTGGLRGIMGAGTNRMNIYTVRRSTEGLARYLLKYVQNAQQKGVAIAYDSRHLSPQFAAEAAGILAYNGIRTYLFQELRPTPMLSFAVRHLGAAAGIVITASHNPPEYNGYKVYGEDGGQIPPSMAELILAELDQIEDELILPTLQIDEGIANGLIHLLGEEIDQEYTKQLLSISLQPDIVKKMGKKFQIVFTPLHGSGNKPVRKVLKEMGFEHVHVVKEQELPDGNFPTVISPNPEEQAAFKLAIQLAKKVDAELILGTDPDADRLGLVTRNNDGEFIVFNGNQIGALLLHYILKQRKEKGRLPNNGVMLKTIVTSELGRVIADSYNVTTVDTLTGFKYIGEKINHYEATGEYQFLFGYEESYGYLLADFIREKDGVQAAVMCCEMAAYYKSNGLTLYEALQQLYQTYGYYLEDIISLTLTGKEGIEKMNEMMDEIRNNPPASIEGYKVKEIKDYLLGIDQLPQANVLKLILEDGSWIAVRPSGTEPKIKFYFGAVAPSYAEVREKLEKLKTIKFYKSSV